MWDTAVELEELIARIADEVYSQLHSEGSSSSKPLHQQASMSPEKSVRSDAKGTCVIGVCMDPGSKVETIDAACSHAKKQRLDSLLIPQWFVAHTRSQLEGTGVDVATVIGLPGGETSTFAKYAEAKEAVGAGATLIVIPVNMRFCTERESAAAKKDFAETLVAAKGKARGFALIEAGMLQRSMLQETVSMCASCGAEGVLLSYTMGGRANPEDVKAASSSGISVGIYGSVLSEGGYAPFESAGCRYFTEGIHS